MWQEYPSYPAEACQVSTDGCYYAAQMAASRVQGRVLKRQPLESAPVYTFWDIGRGDMTSIWLVQKFGPEHRFIGYYEASGEELNHFPTYLQGKGYTYTKHFLPHEAAYRRIGRTPDTNQSIEEMLQELMPGQHFERAANDQPGQRHPGDARRARLELVQRGGLRQGPGATE